MGIGSVLRWKSGLSKLRPLFYRRVDNPIVRFCSKKSFRRHNEDFDLILHYHQIIPHEIKILTYFQDAPANSCFFPLCACYTVHFLVKTGHNHWWSTPNTVSFIMASVRHFVAYTAVFQINNMLASQCGEPPWETPLKIGKSEFYQGVHYFSYFGPKI